MLKSTPLWVISLCNFAFFWSNTFLSIYTPIYIDYKLHVDVKEVSTPFPLHFMKGFVPMSLSPMTLVLALACSYIIWAFKVVLVVKNLTVNAGDRETRVQSLGQEDPLEEGMATHSSILAWRIPWTEEPGRL